VNEHGKLGENLDKELVEARKEALALSASFPCGHRRSCLATQAYFLSATDRSGAPVKWDFIGRTENFNEDFLEIGREVGAKLVKNEIRANSSGGDGQKHVYYNMARNDTELMCSMCRVYIQDYACLGYDFPRECCGCETQEHPV
jgi:hypothetical protein